MTIPRLKTQDPNLQQFADAVGATLNGPENGFVTWSFTREFIFKADLGPVDVAIGPVRPKGLIVLAAEREGEDLFLSGCRIEWSWRSGYARISAVDGTLTTSSGGGPPLSVSHINHKVTLGVVL